MILVETIKKLPQKAALVFRNSVSAISQLDDIALLGGQAAAFQLRALETMQHLHDAEFKVSSQWGEDGIIEWLVSKLSDIPETFVEFGVENYREANTRFLLQNRNWRGLVIDGSEVHVKFIQQDSISWRHDLTAVAAFITRENINSIINQAGFSGEIGILSVDIDGVDYWVWEAIECINPIIIIAEYNSVFGDLLPLTVPYTTDFMRSSAHFSNLYYGLSIRAAETLAHQRGYTMVGTNRAGSNVFFVRNDVAPTILDRIVVVDDRPSRFREARGEDGQVNWTSPADRTDLVSTMAVVNVSTGMQSPLGSQPELFSPRWRAMLRGTKAA